MFKYVVCVVSLVVLSFSIYGQVYYYTNSEKVRYSGEIIFETRQDYYDFKDLILEDKIEVKSASVVDSTLPIWMKYAVVADRDLEWNYSFDSKDATGYYGYDILSIIGIAIGLVCLIPIVFYVIKDIIEGKI